MSEIVVKSMMAFRVIRSNSVAVTVEIWFVTVVREQ